MTNYRIKKPALSVYMPVFNAAPYLASSIESILSQSFKNFEFIIIDDASTDSSWNLIQSYAKNDSRIRAFRNKINLGVSLTSNIAISHTRCSYIARQDADDISSPDRFLKQLNYLKKHPKTVLLGGQCTIINSSNQVIGYKSFPKTQKTIQDMLFWAVPIQQGYMMVNKSLLPTDFSWYSPTRSSAEEVDLFFKLSNYGSFANLKDNLYYYRQIDSSLSRLNPKKTFWLTLQSRLKALKDGYTISFKALLINLAQIFVILILPSKLIYSLWYLLRGVTSHKKIFNQDPAKLIEF